MPGEPAVGALRTHQLREGRVPWAVDTSVRLMSVVWQSNLSFVKPYETLSSINLLSARKKREKIIFNLAAMCQMLIKFGKC